MNNRRLMFKALTVNVFVLSLGLVSPAFAESAGHYIDDATITAKVKEAIYEDSQLKVLQVKVNTLKGVVSLSGAVDAESQVLEAAKVAGQVSGVVAVTNSLSVKSAEAD